MQRFSASAMCADRKYAYVTWCTRKHYKFYISKTFKFILLLKSIFIQGTIADYTPITPPMVPSIVVHCINEVELRGMNEQGLYRVNGAAADVKSLKNKFLKGKGAPNLSNVDIATICSTLKDFFRYIISCIQ